MDGVEEYYKDGVGNSKQPACGGEGLPRAHSSSASTGNCLLTKVATSATDRQHQL